MIDVILQVVVLFLMMFCGFLSIKTRLISNEGITGLNNLVIYFSLPCLTIAKLQQSVDPALVKDLITVFLLACLTMSLFGLLSRYVFFRREPAQRRSVYASMCTFPNVGYMGYPVMTAAFGAGNLIYGVLYVAAFNVLSWSVGVVMFDRSALDLRRLLKIPTLIASMLGIALFALEIRLPGPVFNFLDSMGSITTPLAMFIIGSRLAQLCLDDMKDVKLLLACVLRLLIYPLIAYLLLTVLGFSGLVRAVVVLCSGMPAAAQLVIQADTYGGDVKVASRAVAVSTLLSIATIPVVLLLC